MFFGGVIGSVPYVVSATNAQTNDVNTASLNLALPSGAVVGDLLIVVAGAKRGGTTTFSDPSGMTLLLSSAAGTLVRNLSIWGRFITGSETSPITLTPNQSAVVAACAFLIRGAADLAGAITSSSGGTIPNAPSLSPPSTRTRWFAIEVDNVPEGGRPPPPSGYEDVASAFATISIDDLGVSNSLRVNVVTRAVAVTTEDPAQFGFSQTGQWAAATIAVH